MKLEEAIRILTTQVHPFRGEHSPNLREAVKLGIESAKFRLRWEQQEGEDDFVLLPGETKD